MAPDDVELGGLYRDELTGFEGHAVARLERYKVGWLIAVERLDSNGKPMEVWFPTDRLADVVDDGGVGFR